MPHLTKRLIKQCLKHVVVFRFCDRSDLFFFFFCTSGDQVHQIPGFAENMPVPAGTDESLFVDE
jgi:hypothetical protein